MYQSPVYLSSTSPPTNSYEPRRTEYNQAPTAAFYHLSSSQPAEDSPYWIGSIPAPSTYRTSSPTRRASPSLEKRDSGIDTNIAGLVISGVVGTISICFQAKGNSIASASYQLALASRDAAIGGAQAIGSGVAATGGRVGGTVGVGVMAVGNTVGEVATGVARAGTDAVVSGVSTVGSAASGIAQAGSNTVNTMGAASRMFPSLRFGLLNLNPFRSSPASAPAVDHGEEEIETPFPDRDVRRLQDGTLELFRNLEDGTTQRIAIIDESLFPTINGLPYDDLVQIAGEIADAMFDVGSDTDTDHTVDNFEEAEGENDDRPRMMSVDPFPMYDNQENPWADEIDEE